MNPHKALYVTHFYIQVMLNGGLELWRSRSLMDPISVIWALDHTSHSCITLEFVGKREVSGKTPNWEEQYVKSSCCLYFFRCSVPPLWLALLGDFWSFLFRIVRLHLRVKSAHRGRAYPDKFQSIMGSLHIGEKDLLLSVHHPVPRQTELSEQNYFFSSVRLFYRIFF